jgi:hypothetical protein
MENVLVIVSTEPSKQLTITDESSPDLDGEDQPVLTLAVENSDRALLTVSTSGSSGSGIDWTQIGW